MWQIQRQGRGGNNLAKGTVRLYRGGVLRLAEDVAGEVELFQVLADGPNRELRLVPTTQRTMVGTHKTWKSNDGSRARLLFARSATKTIGVDPDRDAGEYATRKEGNVVILMFHRKVAD